MHKEIRFRTIVLLTVFVATSILSGCGLLTSSKSDLEGTRWKLQSMAGNALAANVLITAEFNDGRISGTSGCNSYGAGFTANNGNLSLDEVAMTAMACTDGGVMDSEQQYMQALNTVKSYKVTSDQLDLLDSAGNTVLTFGPQ